MIRNTVIPSREKGASTRQMLAAILLVSFIALPCSISRPMLAQSPTPAATAQSNLGTPAPAKPQPFSGCLMQSPSDKDTLILNTPEVCAKLTGIQPSDKPAAGHEIDLRGILTPGSGKVPASIQVEQVTRVGKACSAVCSLLPPGKRGLNSEKPGKEGGTPGLVSPPPQQNQR